MHACNVAFSETFVLRSKPHWLHSELLKHWLHSPKDALSTFFTAPHTFPELYCETWLLRQGSVPRVCGIVQKVEKAFVVFFQSCLSAVFVLILRGEEGTIRVAEVGSLLAKAKMPSILSSGVYLQIHGNLVLHILEKKLKSLNIIIKWRVQGLKYL